MLSAYLSEARRLARYELTETGKCFGSIQAFPGVWSEADNLDPARSELQEVLEAWLILSLRRDDTLRVLGSLDLTRLPSLA